MEVNFTEKWVRDLTAPETGQLEYWDENTSGLSLRVSGAGKKSFYLKYRIGKIQHRRRIGTTKKFNVASARAFARNAWLEIEGGRHPSGALKTRRSRGGAGSWAALAARYLEQEGKDRRPKTITEYKWHLNHFILPAFGALKAPDVGKPEVKALLGGIRARGKEVLANRVASTISVVSNFGIREDLLQVNPVTGIYRKPEESKYRVLSADEIRAAWPHFDEALCMLLLTGQHRNEVAGMSWSEIDLDRGLWIISNERTKNKKAHIVPLGSEALRILRAQPHVEGGRVFQRGVSEAAYRAARTAALPYKAPSMKPFTAHDFRRTAATGMAELKVARIVISKVLNHSERGNVTGIYERYEYLDEKRDALMRWDYGLARVLAGQAMTIEAPAIRRGVDA
jgi:integrase